MVSPFQKRFFLFAEDRRHALSFLGKGADEVLLLFLSFCFLFGFLLFICLSIYLFVYLFS